MGQARMRGPFEIRKTEALATGKEKVTKEPKRRFLLRSFVDADQRARLQADAIFAGLFAMMSQKEK